MPSKCWWFNFYSPFRTNRFHDTHVSDITRPFVQGYPWAQLGEDYTYRRPMQPSQSLALETGYRRGEIKQICAAKETFGLCLKQPRGGILLDGSGMSTQVPR